MEREGVLIFSKEGIYIDLGSHYFLIKTDGSKVTGHRSPNSVVKAEKDTKEHRQPVKIVFYSGIQPCLIPGYITGYSDCSEKCKDFLTCSNKVVKGRKNRREYKIADKKAVFTEYIEKRLGDVNVSMEIIAEELGFNPQYFSRIFKEIVGVPFKEYLSQRRIEKARELLKDTSMNVDDIANAIGICSRTTFNRLFKKYTGIAPSQYRTESAGQAINQAAGNPR